VEHCTQLSGSKNYYDLTVAIVMKVKECDAIKNKVSSIKHTTTLLKALKELKKIIDLSQQFQKEAILFCKETLDRHTDNNDAKTEISNYLDCILENNFKYKIVLHNFESKLAVFDNELQINLQVTMDSEILLGKLELVQLESQLSELNNNIIKLHTDNGLAYKLRELPPKRSGQSLMDEKPEMKPEQAYHDPPQKPRM
jgi:hypothetical protein